MKKLLLTLMICMLSITSVFATSANITYLTNGKTIGIVPVKYENKNDIDKLIQEYMPTGYRLNEQIPIEYDDNLVVVNIETAPIVTNIKIKLVGYDDIQLSWNKYYSADEYKIYARRPSKTSKWTYLGRTSDTSFIKENLYDGWRYEFKVIPYNKGFEITKDYSSVTTTTLKKINKPTVTRNGLKVKITWNNVYGGSGYQLRAHRTNKTSYFTTTKEIKELNVKKGVKYTYKVRAYQMVDGKKIYAPWSDYATYTL